METLPIEIAVEFIVPHIVDIKSLYREHTVYNKVAFKNCRRNTWVKPAKKKSPLYNYCLVNKTFNHIFTYYHREWLVSRSVEKLVCKIPLNYGIMNRFIEFYNKLEPKLWIQLREGFGLYSLNKDRYEYLVVPWTMIKCKNSAERFIIHSMADAVGFYHETFIDGEWQHNDKVHKEEYKEYLCRKGPRARKNKRDCVKWNECNTFRIWKSGVIVSNTKLRLTRIRGEIEYDYDYFDLIYHKILKLE